MSNVRIHVLHTGKVYIDRALSFREKTLHPAPFTGWFRPKKTKIWVPVSTYLIEHPNGLILVDTGWSEEVRTDQRKHLGWLASSMFKASLPPGESIQEQLQGLGYNDRQLDYVLLSHLHSDHVSGIKHVAQAKRILTSELELKAAQKDIGYIRSMWEGVSIETFKLQEIPFGPYRAGLDLFGDGSIYLVHTPGHSKGQTSILVKTDNGWVLLASDVGYGKKSWEQGILPGLTINKEEAAQSLSWVGSFAQRCDCRLVLVNHDSDVRPQIIT
jgi:glyoxylase-like metal-dependent hydrolase (beta-lactamase superfamily II)